MDNQHGWIALPLVLDSTFGLRLMLSAYPRSTVSQDVIETLPHLFVPTDTGRYVVTRITLAGEPISGLEVGISRHIRRFDLDGVLGLDFLDRFTDLHLEIATRQVTLSS